MTDPNAPDPLAYGPAGFRCGCGKNAHSNLVPCQPDVIVEITRYTVSVLPADDINHKYFALHVELKPRGWVVHNGHEYYATDGTWQPSQSLAHHFADHDEALSLARESALDLTVNGHTAVDAYRRTYPTP